MGLQPEEAALAELEVPKPERNLGWLRLGILLTTLACLTAFAGATGRLKMPERRPRPAPNRDMTASEWFEKVVLRSGSAVSAFNGFDVSHASIPKDEILRGGPPRDGIPAIDNPKFLSVSNVDFLGNGAQVVGFIENGEARAYPLRILVWHEIVNDTVGGRPIAVTYCPLCGTCMVFDRRDGEEVMTFGVSGLLYNSDMLMYDRESESLWSQLHMESVAGPKVGQKLHWLASEQMSWGAWKERYPDSKVLSTETGHPRSYGRAPYAGYDRTESTYFPVPKTREELRNKAWVVGVVLDGLSKAYPIKELRALGSTPLEDRVGDTQLTVTYDEDRDWVVVTDRATGKVIPNVRSYWFAWQAFYPRTELFALPSNEEAGSPTAP